MAQSEKHDGNIRQSQRLKGRNLTISWMLLCSRFVKDHKFQWPCTGLNLKYISRGGHRPNSKLSSKGFFILFFTYLMLLVCFTKPWKPEFFCSFKRGRKENIKWVNLQFAAVAHRNTARNRKLQGLNGVRFKVIRLFCWLQTGLTQVT